MNSRAFSMLFACSLPEENLTYNIGMVVGGTSVHVDEAGNNGTATGKDNVIAPVAYASGDIRTISNQQTARVEKKMQAIVAHHLPRTDRNASPSAKAILPWRPPRKAAHCSAFSTRPTQASDSNPCRNSIR